VTNSVNTNPGALTALASMRGINTRLDTNAKMLQTGYRIADAYDDASVFAIAQGVRSNIKAHASVQSSLNQGLGLVDVTLAAMRDISNLIGEMRSTLMKASDGSLSTPQRDIYKNDALAIHNRILLATNAADYNGKNQTIVGATNVTFVADVSGNTITVGTYGINPAWNNLGTAINAITDAATGTAAYNLINPLEQSLNATTAVFAATRRQIVQQISFNEDLIEATKKGLGALVDADVAQVMATQQSLLAQRELATNSLSIANSRPQTLLTLIR